MQILRRAQKAIIRAVGHATGPAELPSRQRLYAAFALFFGLAFLVSLPVNVAFGYPPQQQGLAVAMVLLMAATYLSQRFDHAARLTASLSPYAMLATIAAFTLLTGGSGGAMSYSLSFLVVSLVIMPLGQRAAFLATLLLTIVGLTAAEFLRPEWFSSPYAGDAERLGDVAFTIVSATVGMATALLYLESQVRLRTEQLESANRALTEQSLTDPLTGLHNRRYLEDALAEDLALLRRRCADRQPERHGWALLLVDLDRFKDVNDQHGHVAGDLVLTHAATLISQTVRRSDIVVRWGGEEFLVVARGVEGQGSVILAERLRTAFENAIVCVPNGRQLKVTCSIGVAPYPLFKGALDLVSWEAHLSLADHAMYEAKRSGRNASCCAAASPRIPPPGQWPATASEMIAAGLIEFSPASAQLPPPAAAREG